MLESFAKAYHKVFRSVDTAYREPGTTRRISTRELEKKIMALPRANRTPKENAEIEQRLAAELKERERARQITGD